MSICYYSLYPQGDCSQTLMDTEIHRGSEHDQNKVPVASVRSLRVLTYRFRTHG